MTRVLLIYMPLTVPTVPSLALQLLAGILNSEGFLCDTFYGTLRLRRTPVLDSYIHSIAGEVVFTPTYFRERSPEAIASRLMDCTAGVSELQANYSRFKRATQTDSVGVTWPIQRRANTGQWPFGTHFDGLLSDVLTHMDLAEACIEHCLNDIPNGHYDVYGFSVAFDSQKMASLALAQRLKERDPSCKIAFGGTACDGDMGHELIRYFRCVDVVTQGDADLTIGSLISAMRGHIPMDSIPGVIYREGANIVSTSPSQFLQNLDLLPIPDYGQFLEQRQASDWKDEDPFILFEASRGCWWGEKHHCKFCGLRADGLSYRRKSAMRTRTELETLATKYPSHRALYSTDAILDHRYLKEFFPSIREMSQRHRWKLFFEIKSNLRKNDVALLSEAGVSTVQPGVESFSDHILKLMDKGNTGLKHVQLLKWLQAYRIDVIYNLIIGTPGEKLEDYEEMLDLLPSLTHLPAPSQVNFLSLDKFSPYFREPERYDITNVAPELAYSVIYPDPDLDLSRLVYKFTYNSREYEDSSLRDSWIQLETMVQGWKEERERRSFWMSAQGDLVHLIEEIDGEVYEIETLTGLAAKVYMFCDACRDFDEICHAFPDVAKPALRFCLERWVTRRWMCRSASCCYLALAVDLAPPESQPSIASKTLENTLSSTNVN